MEQIMKTVDHVSTKENVYIYMYKKLNRLMDRRKSKDSNILFDVILDYSHKILSGDVYALVESTKSPSGVVILEDQWSLVSIATQ
jgi:hypothetical protein